MSEATAPQSDALRKPPPAAAPSNDGAPAQAATGRGWNPLLVPLVVLALLGSLVFLFTTNWDNWVGSRAEQSTDDAYVQTELTPIVARVAGYVRNVPVDDFQKVRAGEALVELEDDDYKAQVAEAEANVAGSDAAIDNNAAQQRLQDANIAAADAAITATRADLERARLENLRQQALVRSADSSRQTLEQATANYDRTKATLDQNAAQALAQRRQLEVLITQAKQLIASRDAARAALDLARINLRHTRLVAPADGMVTQRQVFPGQYLGVGGQVMTFAPLPHVWVMANFKEIQLTRVGLGDLATMTVDAFPGMRLKGRVAGWSPASGSQLSLLPPDNATGNFTKVVQRLPVKIELDDDSGLGARLRPGMSVVATIHVRASPALAAR